MEQGSTAGELAPTDAEMEGSPAAGRWRFLTPPPPSSGKTSEVAWPSFSVIVAAYDVAPLIAAALDSALAQTYPPLEIIVCDDGSTDDLAAALEPYRSSITLLQQPHLGVGAAKDTAARAAKGDYVVVLDADDIFLPERLEALAHLAVARPDLDILTTDAWVELEDTLLARYTEMFIAFPVAEQRRRILERCFPFPLAAIRRQRLLEVGGFEPTLRSGVDWDLWIRLFLSGGGAGCVDAPLAHYRIRPGSVTSDMVHRAQNHVRVVELALANPLCTEDDREILKTTLSNRRRQMKLAAAESALRVGAADARRRLLSIALGADASLLTRLKCAVSALAPAQAARFLSLRERRVGKSRLGRPVPRQ